MLFKDKKCKKCSTNYDPVLEKCPNCETINEDYKEGRFSKDLSWLSTLKQLFVFLMGCVGYYAITFIVELIVIKVNNATEFDARMTAITISLSYGFLLLALIGIINKDFPKKILGKMKNPKAYGYGLVLGIAYIVISILYGLFLTYVIKLPSDNTNQSLVVSYVKSYPALAFFVVVLIGPICEELTYRVGLFNLLLRSKRWIAYVVTAVLFGLIHFDFTAKDMIVELWNLPTYMLGGLVFAFIYDRYGFAASLTAHVLNNFISFILTVI